MKKMHKTKDAYTNESNSYLVQHRVQLGFATARITTGAYFHKY